MSSNIKCLNLLNQLIIIFLSHAKGIYQFHFKNILPDIQKSQLPHSELKNHMSTDISADTCQHGPRSEHKPKYKFRYKYRSLFSQKMLRLVSRSLVTPDAAVAGGPIIILILSCSHRNGQETNTTTGCDLGSKISKCQLILRTGKSCSEPMGFQGTGSTHPNRRS